MLTSKLGLKVTASTEIFFPGPSEPLIDAEFGGLNVPNHSEGRVSQELVWYMSLFGVSQLIGKGWRMQEALIADSAVVEVFLDLLKQKNSSGKVAEIEASKTIQHTYQSKYCRHTR